MCRRTTEDRREDLFHGVTLSSPSPPFIHTCGEEKRAGDYRGRNIRTYRVDVDPLLRSTHRKARDCGNYTLWANMSQFVILPRTRTTESAVIMDKRCINQRFRKKILPRAGLWSKVEQNQEIFFFVCVHSFEHRARPQNLGLSSKANLCPIMDQRRQRHELKVSIRKCSGSRLFWTPLRLFQA